MAFSPVANNQESTKTPADLFSTTDDAITIAMPIVEQYAEENNRTITTMVEASLSNYVDSRPSWQIDIKFDAIQRGEEHLKDVQYWIDAYQVSVWADTGEIKSHNVRGWY